jgi:GH43 family beta-xylosidase
MAEVVEDANFPDPLVDGFVKVTNPVCGGADPSFEYYNGKYYWTAGFLGTIIISPFDSLQSVSTSGAVPVDYRIFPNNDDIWAPELHYIDGTWYMYYTAGKDDAHRMYVLRGKTDDPLGEYEFVGQVTDPTNKWAIDGSIFEYKGELYFIWSGWEGDVNYAQNIYIARMSSPTTISSERVCLSVPEKIWEVQGGSPLVNEGPCAITSGDYLTILYSASGSWCDDYCIGQLLFRGGDVLDPSNWEKQPEPILKKDPAWFYGPGHCCITTDENGIMWIVFHANDVSGTGWNGRSIRMYPIRINEKGVVEVILYR